MTSRNFIHFLNPLPSVSRFLLLRLSQNPGPLPPRPWRHLWMTLNLLPFFQLVSQVLIFLEVNVSTKRHLKELVIILARCLCATTTTVCSVLCISGTCCYHRCRRCRRCWCGWCSLRVEYYVIAWTQSNFNICATLFQKKYWSFYCIGMGCVNFYCVVYLNVAVNLQLGAQVYLSGPWENIFKLRQYLNFKCFKFQITLT